MKICMITTKFSPTFGGAQIATHEVAKRLKEKGHSVYLITRREKNLKKNEIIDGIFVFRTRFLDFPMIRYESFMFTAFLCWHNIIKKDRCNVVHIMGARLAPLAPLFKKFSNIPIVVTGQGPGISIGLHQRIRGKIGLWGLKKVDRITVVTPWLKNILMELGISSEKVTVIYHGTDIKRFSTVYSDEIRKKYISNDEKLIVTACKLHPVKGLSFLLEAIKILKEEGLKIRLLILGEGPQKPILQSLMYKLNLDDLVFFAGYIPYYEMPKYFSSADIFAIPSISEGLPKTLIEASVAGKPVVVTDCGGMKVFVSEIGNGLVVPRADVPALAKAIKLLLNDEKLYEEMKRNAYKARNKKILDWNTSIEQYIRIYEELKGHRAS